MVKKDTPLKKKSTKNIPSPAPDTSGTKRLNGETLQFVAGLLLIGLSLYLLISFVSFFITGSADQSIINSLDYEERLSEIRNYTGLRGAQLSNFFISDCFGYAAVCIPVFLMIAGFRLIHVGHFHLWKWFLALGFGMVWTSVFLAFLEKSIGEFNFFCLGGIHGLRITEWFYGQFGWPGTFLILLISAIIYLIYLSKQTIYWVRKIFSLGINTVKHPRHKKTEAPTGNNPETSEAPATSAEVNTEEKETASPHPEEEQTVEFTIDDKAESLPSSPGMAADMTEKTEKADIPSQTPATGNTEKPNDITFDIEEGKKDDVDPATPPKPMERYNPRLGLEFYKFPTLDLLKNYGNEETSINTEEQIKNKDRIITTLHSFGIEISSIKATVGPTVTLYEITPAAGVRISKIRNLEDDIAQSLSAKGIGIEVPNEHPRIVPVQSILASRKFLETTYDLPVAIGRTITNEVYMFDLCKMPHLLVAGATGQGKSVGLNVIITSLLYKKHPAELKFVLIDPKKVEFSIYSEIEKNYLAKLPDAEKAVITDSDKVIATLNSLCIEMDNRYALLAKANVRTIKEYNDEFIHRRLNPNNGHKFMPYIVVVIDEFADLIMMAGRDVEMPIARIAQKARAVGIHMVIATQRPSTTVITGNIKANFPARIAFRVMQMVDSRTILDAPGANQLIGRGDMLFTEGGELKRIQCAFIDTQEVKNICEYISHQQGYPEAYELPEYKSENSDSGNSGDMTNRDPLFEEAAKMIVVSGQASTSSLQRRYSIGYNRAGRLMDQLEAAGIVGPSEGGKPRQVLISDIMALENKLELMK